MASSVCDSTKHNGLVTKLINFWRRRDENSQPSGPDHDLSDDIDHSAIWPPFNYFVNFSRDHLLWTIGPDTAQVSHRHLILKHRYLLIVNLLLSFLRVSIRAWLMHDLIHNSTNLLLLAYSQLLSNLLRLIRVHIQALFFTTG